LIFCEFGTIIITEVCHWLRSFGTEPQLKARGGYGVPTSANSMKVSTLETSWLKVSMGDAMLIV